MFVVGAQTNLRGMNSSEDVYGVIRLLRTLRFGVTVVSCSCRYDRYNWGFCGDCRSCSKSFE